jgi:hypothetical protein
MMMIEITKPKVGLVGVMATPFRGDKESNYRSDRAHLESMAGELGFEFRAVKYGIYSTEQAAQAAVELEGWGADFVLLQTSSFASGDFLYPFTDLDARLGIWTVPEGPPTSEGGLPLNSFTAANMYNSIIRRRLSDYDRPVKWFFGHPGQKLFDDRLMVTVQALRALINLPDRKIALIGGVAPSFDNLIIDDSLLQERLGISVLHIEMDELLKRTQSVEESDAVQAAQEIQSTATVIDPKYSDFLLRSGRVFQAVSQMAEEYAFDGVGLSCWPRFQSNYQLAVCSVMGHLNGAGLIAACEGDVTSAVSMLMLYFMTNGDTVTLMDMVSMDDTDDSALLWHCGPTSPKLADDHGTIMQPLWLFDGVDGTRTGLHNDLVLKPGKGTVLGFTTDFAKMLVLEGVIDNQKPSYMGSRGWLTEVHMNNEKITIPALIQTLMVSGFQHHYPFAYGSLGEAGLELCSWIGIKPIRKEVYTNYLK